MRISPGMAYPREGGGRAAADRLGPVPVGQLLIGKPTASEIVDRMQPPTGGCGARLAEATAVAEGQGASGPTHGGTGRFLRADGSRARLTSPIPSL
jgi:hypothetical protein